MVNYHPLKCTICWVVLCLALSSESSISNQEATMKRTTSQKMSEKRPMTKLSVQLQKKSTQVQNEAEKTDVPNKKKHNERPSDQWQKKATQIEVGRNGGKRNHDITESLQELKRYPNIFEQGKQKRDTKKMIEMNKFKRGEDESDDIIEDYIDDYEKKKKSVGGEIKKRAIFELGEKIANENNLKKDAKKRSEGLALRKDEELMKRGYLSIKDIKNEISKKSLKEDEDHDNDEYKLNYESFYSHHAEGEEEDENEENLEEVFEDAEDDSVQKALEQLKIDLEAQYFLNRLLKNF